MRICITGALGHIGSKLIHNLSSLNLDKIYLVDDLSTQRYPSLFNLPAGQPFEFVECDIGSDKMVKIIEDSDHLIHLAAITNAEQSFDRQKDIELVNIHGLMNVANLCADSGCTLIFPSSTSVYGSQEIEVDEDCPENELKPQSPYADSKIQGEEYLKKLGANRGLRYVTLRLGTIFGYSPGMRFHTAVNKFIWQACMGLPITVWRTALDQRRPYCGVSDAANAFMYLIQNDLINCKTYNLVTNNYSVSDVINEIRYFIPSLSINFVDSPIMNQLSYNVSNAKSKGIGIEYTDNLRSRIGEVVSILENAKKSIPKLNL